MPAVLARHPPELSFSPQFLSLDDLPDSRSSMDLRSDPAPGVSAPPLHPWGCWKVAVCPWLTRSRPLQETLIVPLLPMALVAPDEVEKNSNPLYRCGRSLVGWAGVVGEGSL